MKRSFIPLSIVGISALAAYVAPASAAPSVGDQVACYKSDLFPDERLVLDVKYHSVLVRGWQDLVNMILGGVQTTYSVHGKHVHAEAMIDGLQGNGPEWLSVMADVTGTMDLSLGLDRNQATVAAKDARWHVGQTGAHMGLLANWVRGDGYEGEKMWARPVHFDCGSLEQNQVPGVWTCQVYNDFDLYFGSTDYVRVANPSADEVCDQFETMPGTEVPLFESKESYADMPPP